MTYIPHYRPSKQRLQPRDVDCYVLRQRDFPKGCWAKGGADWSAHVKLQRLTKSVLESDWTGEEHVRERRLLVLRIDATLAVKHRCSGILQRFTLRPSNLGVVPECPRCRRGMRTLWMPEHQDVLGCRRCVRVRYTSQTQNSNRYHLHAARLVEQQLMVDPENPALLERLEQHADSHAYIGDVQFLAQLSKGPMSSLVRQGGIDIPSALARLRA